MDKTSIQGPKPLGPGEGLTAPIPISRGPDPLDMDVLRYKELSTDQLISLYEDMTRRDVNPEVNEPHYRHLVRLLVRAESEYRDLNAMAEWRYRECVKIRDLIEGLGLDNLEKIRDYAQANDSVDVALQVWKNVYGLYHRIHDTLVAR